jgi:hypothetical protein
MLDTDWMDPGFSGPPQGPQVKGWRHWLALIAVALAFCIILGISQHC